MAFRKVDGQLPGQYYSNLFRNYAERSKDDRNREERNWKIYSGVDYGQWDAIALQQLLDEKRPPHQINFTQNKINTLLGSFLQNPFELRYESEMGASNDEALLLNQLYMIDKERGTWAKARRMFMLAGLIFRGTVEMYTDYSVDPTGSISLRYIPHKRIYFDPDWESDNINDNKEILMPAWMTPPQIKEIYHKRTPEIEEAIRQWEKSYTTRTEDVDADKLVDRSGELYDIANNRFLVIQAVKLEIEERDRLFDKEANLFLPDMDETNMRIELGIRQNTLQVVKDRVGVVKMETTVPGLDWELVLEKGDYPTQIGRYPFTTWSALNLHGQVQGVVDVLKDPQEIFNKRQSTYTHAQTTAVNGAELVESDFFETGEFERYNRTKNKPGETYKVQPGKLSLQKPGIMIRPRENLPTDMVNEADRMLSLSETTAPVPPALQGGEGKSGESGRLFEAKRNQALVALEPMSQSLMEKEHEFGEMYFYMVKQVYGGNRPRMINNKRTGKPILLNFPTPDGRVVNSIDALSRHGIIINQAKSGVTVKRELLAKYIDVLGLVQNPILRSFIEKQIVSVLPNIPDSDVEKAMAAAEVFEKVQFMRSQMEIAQMEQALQQLGQQAAQGQGITPTQQGTLPPGKTPAEGGGFSVEGAGIPTDGGIPIDINKQNQLR